MSLRRLIPKSNELIRQAANSYVRRRIRPPWLCLPDMETLYPMPSLRKSTPKSTPKPLMDMTETKNDYRIGTYSPMYITKMLCDRSNTY